MCDMPGHVGSWGVGRSSLSWPAGVQYPAAAVGLGRRMLLARFLLMLAAAGVLGMPPTGGAQPAARAAARQLRRVGPLAAPLKTDDFGAAGEVELPSLPLGVPTEGMVGRARAGQTVDAGAPIAGTSSRPTKDLSRGQPKPRPAVDKAHQDKLHEEFLSKPEDVVARNIKSQTEGGASARIEEASLTRTPPEDYYMCVQVYMRELGEWTPLIHSLCTWWSQAKEDAPEAEPSVRSSASHSQGLMCKQIRKVRQCFRFDGDPFLKSPRLNDFTKHCSMNCLGRTTAGSREGIGGR